MPRLNVDEQKGLYEPLVIVLEGKTYTVTKVTSKMIQEATKAGEGKDIDTISRQLSIFLNEPVETFKDIDIRKLGAVVRFLTEIMTSQLEGKEAKNASEAGEKK